MPTDVSASTDWKTPFFARAINVTRSGDIIVDGRKVAIFGVTLTDADWPAELKRLLKRRRVYIMPMRHGQSNLPAVRLFCGRGDLASYLIWYGRADAEGVHYVHVQLARAVRNLAFASGVVLKDLWRR